MLNEAEKMHKNTIKKAFLKVQEINKEILRNKTPSDERTYTIICDEKLLRPTIYYEEISCTSNEPVLIMVTFILKELYFDFIENLDDKHDTTNVIKQYEFKEYHITRLTRKNAEKSIA